MKRINLHPSSLQILYLIIIFILFSFIIYTPTLISGPVHITKRLMLEENTIEGILLGILFIVSILILNLYKQEVNSHKELIHKINQDKKKVEERLHISDQYIGKVNVQIEEIKSIYNSIDNYPKSKTELKKTLTYFGQRILGIVSSNWVLIRIINCGTQRTISEHFEARMHHVPDYPHISNKMIIKNRQLDSHTTVIYSPDNLDILVFCVLPADKISHDERVFIEAIIDELTKLFAIINSLYYKNENKTEFR
jgi:hypothetical protein